MSRVDHQRLRELFEAVMDLPPGERAAILDAGCGEDRALRAEIDSLLRHHDADGPVLSDQQAGIGMRAAQASDPIAEIDTPPEHIGPYRVLRVLASGGMGTVYEAEQEQPVRRRVALKVIKLGMDTREVVARFEHERQTLAKMDHPNIARVYDAGATAAGRPFFVMELCQGDTITTYCDKQKLPVRERLDLFTQVCRAVQHAHQRGIIHRDLKPSNILVSTHEGRPHVRVIDFGIAKAMAGDSPDLTVQHDRPAFIGTPDYMSPEQADGGRDIDTRADVYSLGVLLFELLTGRTPFAEHRLHQASFVEIQRVIRDVDPVRPSSRLRRAALTGPDSNSPAMSDPRDPGLSTMLRGELDWIVLKAIEKDRQRRYDSVGQFCADVERFLAGDVVLAAPPSQVYRFRKFVARHRALVCGASAALLALIVGLCGTLWQAGVARREARLARARSEELRQVADLQAELLGQIDVTDAGAKLFDSLSRRFDAESAKSGLSEPDIASLRALFDRQLGRINPTDVASELIDNTLLRPAIAAMEKQLADQPAVLAALQQTLAGMYRSMGRYSDARPLQESALAFRRRALGDEHPDTLASFYATSYLLRLQGEVDAAASMLNGAYPVSVRCLGPDHPTTLDMLNLRGGIFLMRGRLKEAEVCWRETLERRRRILGENNRDTFFSINNLGLVLEQQGRLDEAEVYYREALEKRRRVLGEDHPDTMISLNFIGQLCTSQRKFEEAGVYLHEAVDKRRKSLGENHPRTLNSLANLGLLYARQGRADEAEPILRDVMDKRRMYLGADHALTLDAVGRYCDVLESIGRWEASEPLRRDAVAHWARQGPLNDREWIGARMALARTLTRLNRVRDAERELLDTYQTISDSDAAHVEIRRHCAESLVQLYENWKRLQPLDNIDDRLNRWRITVQSSK